MRCRPLLITLFLSLFWMGFLTPSEGQDTDRLWERGRQAADRGDIELALKIWESAVDSLRPDPRIGLDYIELVTEEERTGLYQKASSLFYWGFSDNCTSNDHDYLDTELERVSPLISRSQYAQWKSLIDKDVNRFCNEYTKFWQHLDPTLSTYYNERLIEHWERIAFARQKFNENRSTIYQADDRALIYVKLGEPDLKRSGNLNFSQPLVRSWVNDVIDRQFRGGGISSNLGSDSAGSAGGAVGTNSEAGIAAQSMSQLWARVDMADRYAKQAELLHRYQRYEIWIYDRNLKHSAENLVYIFGQDGETGSFGLRKSLDEMIPGRAFRDRSSRGSILRPGILLQLMYYQQFTHLDNYFADAFSSIESRLLVTNGLHRTTSLAVKDQNEHKLSYIQVRAPDQISNHLEDIPTLSLNAYQYRFLNNDNQPYLASYLISRPQKAFFFDQVMNEDFNEDAYNLVFNARVSNKHYDIISLKSANSEINSEGRGDVEEMKPSVVFFELPQSDQNYIQTFTAELIHKRKKDSKIGQYAFPESLRALGYLQSEQPQALDTDAETLEMSDILIGVDESSKSRNSTKFPGFSVKHDRIIPENRNMRLYFEVYHLVPEQNSTSKFQVEYRLRSKSRNLLQRIFGGGDKVGLTLNFETLDTYYKTDLELVTSSFDPGRYELSLRVLEPSTGREKTATLDVTIE